VKDTPGTIVAVNPEALADTFGGLVIKMVEFGEIFGQAIAPLVAIDPLVVSVKPRKQRLPGCETELPVPTPERRNLYWGSSTAKVSKAGVR
jgi:hypothetical protein